MKYKCYKCEKEYEIKDIRFTESNKYECVYCLGVKPREILVKPEQKNIDKQREEMVDYLCTGCGFAFKRKKSFVLGSCPYCSKQGTVTVKKSTSADNLIDESKDNRYDI